MTTAMMLPFAAKGLHHVIFRSFAVRRVRSAAGFLLGYLGACGAVCASLLLTVHGQQELVPRLPAAFVASGALVLATGWQRTALRRRLLMACHRTAPLAPLGWRADRDVLSYGLRIGGTCGLVCWPTMLGTMFDAASPALMVGCFVLAVAERSTLRAGSRTPAFLLLAAAGGYALLALDDGWARALGDLCRSRA